jgi:hypothetical protein
MLLNSLLQLILGFCIILSVLVFAVGLNIDIALKIVSAIVVVVYLVEYCILFDKGHKAHASKAKYR